MRNLIQTGKAALSFVAPPTSIDAPLYGRHTNTVMAISIAA